VKWWPRAGNGGGSGCRSACNNSPMKSAGFFPLAQARRREVSLRSELGNVKLVVKYGPDRPTQPWLCPLLRHWGMGPHQKITPAWAEKLCFTVTATGSYEEAAQVASKTWCNGQASGRKGKPSNVWSIPRWKGNPSVPPAVWRC